ncbi:SLC13 family permease [Flavonifractor sp. AGMB03687]|uniref:SLC13 family permease n=1 Tax=Flavonifractor sp. AGMB03687 TaxID=2785133 RepID=UPI001AE06E47|nr:SLC13 family permease [Flavonifractor sp. AGMB03687]
MKQPKKLIGLLAGILLCVVICLLPLEGLSHEGQLCLGLTLMTVVWWAAQVAQSGYVSGIYLMLLCLLKVADTSVIFSGWTGSTIWLVAGAYLIASAVRSSGLGERLSYAFILRFVRGWRSIIVSIFVLTLILSLLIPHPWPRAFLIMSVMMVVIRSASIPQKDAAVIGFTVFAASVPVSLIFITGDSTINPLAMSYADEAVSFVGWLKVMGPPALVLSLLTMVLILVIFKPSAPVSLDLEQIKEAQAALGKMSQREIRALVWVLIAVVLWLTNGITGLDIGWITLLVAMLMSLPVVGEVLGPKDWAEVPVHVMVFLTAAIAIGKVGAATGMNSWIADTLLPASMPEHPVLLALGIALIAVVIHMFMGSVIAVMGVTIPAFLSFTAGSGISPLAVISIVYLSVAGHYVLPFHHLNILVGQGEENGMYTQRETMKMSVPLLLALLVTIALSVGWWSLLGLM